MNEYIILENFYIYKLKKLISQMLDNEIMFTYKGKNTPSLLSDYQNCKPFLKIIHKKLIINKGGGYGVQDIFNKNHNLNYLYYIIKGYDMTLETYDTYQYYGDHLLVTEIKDNIYTIIKYYNKLFNKQLKFIRRKYIDNFTNKVLYHHLVDDIYRLAY
tara:strand:+ start:134 stop:607 length:474 start_codon:yes stop_codon:yes gene_type:complete